MAEVITLKVEVDEKESIKSLQNVNKELENVGDSVDENSESLKGSQQNTSELLSSFNLMPASVGKISSSFFTLSKGIGSGTKAMKLFRLALISTGIGALLVAFGSLIAYFQRTEEGASKLKQILAPIGVFFENLMDIVADLGGVLIKMFTDPKQAILDFFGVLEDVSNIVEETRRESEIAVQLEKDRLVLVKDRRAFLVEEAKLMAEKAELILKSRDMEISAQERADALTTALNIQKDISEERLRLAEEDLRIKQETSKLAQDDGAALDALAEAEKKVYDVKKQGSDQVREVTNRIITEEAKIKAEKKAQNLETEKQIENEQKLLDALIKSNEERIKEIDVEDFDEPGFDADKIIKDFEDEQALRAELRELSVSNLDEYYENEQLKEQERFEAELQALGDNWEAIELAKKVHDKKMSGISEDRVKTEAEIDKITFDNKLALMDAIAGLSAVLSSLFAADTVAHKAFGIATIGIDTAIGIMKALALPLPPPAPQIQAAAIGVAGASQAAKVAGIKFAMGGILEGPSHEQGGILTPFGVLEGGEGVINSLSMTNESLRNMASAANSAGGGNDFSVGDGTIKLSEESLDGLAIRINDKQVFVVETDISEAQNRVAVIEDEAVL